MAAHFRWKKILDERVSEAMDAIGRVDGVHGLIIGGSVGRGDAWPMSDIDLIPVYDNSMDPAWQVERCRAMLVDWWVTSGPGHALEVGWPAFTVDEVAEATTWDSNETIKRMQDVKWFHGIDKASGGRAGAGGETVERFVEWATRLRFDEAVRLARAGYWRMTAELAVSKAVQMQDVSAVLTTQLLSEAARFLCMALAEQWGDRLGSINRCWTHFECLAQRNNALPLARRLARVGGAESAGAMARASTAPSWLQERIDVVYQARRLAGEEVTPDENARDQLAAFTLLTGRQRPDLDGSWILKQHSSVHDRIAGVEQLLVDLPLIDGNARRL